MQFASREEFEALEIRVLKAEQRARQADAQVRSLQERIDALTGGAGGAVVDVSHVRSHSPGVSTYPMRPELQMAMQIDLNKGRPCQHQLRASMSVQEFAQDNHLDGKCFGVLSNQSVEAQQYVMMKGPVEGRNPSAMVMSRIGKYISENGAVGAPTPPGLAGGSCGGCGFGGHGQEYGYGSIVGNAMLNGVHEKVEAFCVDNGIDDKCSESLRSQSLECQINVIEQGPADGRNPSAMVMGRINKFMRGKL
mmetsp:Transcript_41710/g.110380  ORF Transcript_41710/g.110380 Transcript_41710/m.110380 type:complete len:250 (-) Transcript_41710:251-1000(-)